MGNYRLLASDSLDVKWLTKSWRYTVIIDRKALLFGAEF
uniref:Uncharacterized protein n=1 Tax=Anguilla anguilla TaxID=7936 RepID=A0A0E9UEE3_ANGAN